MVRTIFPAVEDLIISADNRFIYASNGENNIEILDIQTGKKQENPLSNPGAVNKLRMSANRQLNCWPVETEFSLLVVLGSRYRRMETN